MVLSSFISGWYDLPIAGATLLWYDVLDQSQDNIFDDVVLNGGIFVS